MKQSSSNATGRNGSRAAAVRMSALGRSRRAHLAEDFDREQLLAALTSLKRGSFEIRLPEHWIGLNGKIADAFNEVVELNQRMSQELERLSQAVGKEGRIAERASLGDFSGSWAASVQSVNTLISDLVYPTSETARVIGAVAKGDLSQTM